MRKLSEEEIEFELRNIKASFAFEDLFVTDEELEKCRKILRGETTAEAEIARIYEELGLPWPELEEAEDHERPKRGT